MIKQETKMKAILGLSLVLALVSLDAMAGWGRDDRYRPAPRYEYISVRAQSYFPDMMTAQAICRLNRVGDAVTFTQYKQAGDRIDGKRSFDGRPNFLPETWGGGMSLDVITCSGGYGGGGPGGGGQSVTISVSRQLFYPDQMTAQAICTLNGYYRAVGFTSEKVAGDKIDGKRSFDGRPNFLPATWHGGNDIENVFCR
jgi:hypothetical protein